jgi:hypothetical protein
VYAFIDVQQEAITWSIFGTQQFFDEVQVLMAFEIVWMVGFVWSFFIKAPGNIHSLFLRSKLFVQSVLRECVREIGLMPLCSLECPFDLVQDAFPKVQNMSLFLYQSKRSTPTTRTITS